MEKVFSSIVSAFKLEVFLTLSHDQHITKPEGWCDIQYMNVLELKPNSLPLEMQLNPNPAKDFIMVQFNELITGKLLILDMSGKSLFERQLYDVIDTQIDCSLWMNCMYLVRFESNDTKEGPVVRKLVIQKN